MNENSESKVYQEIIENLERHVQVDHNGLLSLQLEPGSLSGANAVAYYDFVRSLEVTNRKIKAGEISAEEILTHSFNH